MLAIEWYTPEVVVRKSIRNDLDLPPPPPALQSSPTPANPHSPAVASPRAHKHVPAHRLPRQRMRACVCVCVRARACACVRACVDRKIFLAPAAGMGLPQRAWSAHSISGTPARSASSGIQKCRRWSQMRCVLRAAPYTARGAPSRRMGQGP